MLETLSQIRVPPTELRHLTGCRTVQDRAFHACIPDYDRRPKLGLVSLVLERVGLDPARLGRALAFLDHRQPLQTILLMGLILLVPEGLHLARFSSR